jgi:excisionase family DNA binding protein
MSEQPATLQGVTVAEAATILGVSTATVRRMVKRGDLEGERVLRPQGSVFVVRLRPDTIHATADAHDAAGTLHEAGGMPRSNASPGEQLAAWSETFLLPLVAVNERQAARIEELARENGRLSAERDAARVEIERATPMIDALSGRLEEAAATVEVLRAELQAVRTPEPPQEAPTAVDAVPPPVDSPTPLPAVWMRWGPVLAVLGMVVVIALVLLFVPR